jgi:alpha-N-arabinofuranosidase
MTDVDVRVVLDSRFPIGEVNPRLFGSFVEHMGRCVYGGIYEPGHALADETGLRKDVLALTAELGVTTVRYPGGNFVSNYRWEDGVGPKEARPIRRDLAWRSIETNQFGLNEFIDWARKVDVEPMLALNLGTRGVAEALELLEYCNAEPGTQFSDLRVSHGYRDPHHVRLWCLGNEMDGPWQIGHKTADEYGRLAQETARAMKRFDPDIRLVACGSSNAEMPTFGSWEATVLRHCYDLVDYISLHAYYEPHGDDLVSFLASGTRMDRFIEGVVATADHIRAAGKHAKRIELSFDEWNVWYQGEFEGEDSLPWTQAPRLIENAFTVADAVVVGGLLISLLNHADRVTIACQAQLVNIIAPIRAEADRPAWRQTIFHPFAATAAHGRGIALRAAVEAPQLVTAEHGSVAAVDVAATIDDDSGAVFLVNRTPDRPMTVDITLQNLRGVGTAHHTVLADDDLSARNTINEPNRVVLSRSPLTTAGENRLAVTLPPASWNMVTFTGVAGR